MSPHSVGFVTWRYPGWERGGFGHSRHMRISARGPLEVPSWWAHAPDGTDTDLASQCLVDHSLVPRAPTIVAVAWWCEYEHRPQSPPRTAVVQPRRTTRRRHRARRCVGGLPSDRNPGGDRLSAIRRRFWPTPLLRRACQRTVDWRPASNRADETIANDQPFGLTSHASRSGGADGTIVFSGRCPPSLAKRFPARQ